MLQATNPDDEDPIVIIGHEITVVIIIIAISVILLRLLFIVESFFIRKTKYSSSVLLALLQQVLVQGRTLGCSCGDPEEPASCSGKSALHSPWELTASVPSILGLHAV